MEIIINNNDNNHLNTMKSIETDINKLIIISPFLSTEADTLLSNFNHIKSVELYTNLDGFGVADTIIKATKRLYEYCNSNDINLTVKYNNSLHGKAYLFYNDNTEKGFTITSANFTERGLINNKEFGVYINNPDEQKNFYNSIINMSFSLLKEHEINMLLPKVLNFEKNNDNKKNQIFFSYTYLKQRNYNISINECKIKEKIEEYKKGFPERFTTQKYIWEAVKTFQNKWEINSSDFSNMYKHATADAENLLSSKGFLPRNYIIKQSCSNPNEIKELFINLYNDDTPLENRVNNFINELEKYKGKSYHEDIIAVSTYLWLMYPSKYYFYKWSVASEIAKMLDAYSPKLPSSHFEKMLWAFELYDQIKYYLLKERDLQMTMQNLLSGNCYVDIELSCLTIDFCFFIRPLYANRKDTSRRDV